MNRIELLRKHIEGDNWVVDDLLKEYASYLKTWKQVYRVTLLPVDLEVGSKLVSQRCFTRDENLASQIMSSVADEQTSVLLELDSVRGISILEVYKDLVNTGYKEVLADLKHIAEAEDEIVVVDTEFEVVEKNIQKIIIKDLHN